MWVSKTVSKRVSRRVSKSDILRISVVVGQNVALIVMERHFADRSQKWHFSLNFMFLVILTKWHFSSKDIWFHRGVKTAKMTLFDCFPDMPDLVGFWCRILVKKCQFRVSIMAKSVISLRMYTNRSNGQNRPFYSLKLMVKF